MPPTERPDPALRANEEVRLTGEGRRLAAGLLVALATAVPAGLDLGCGGSAGAPGEGGPDTAFDGGPDTRRDSGGDRAIDAGPDAEGGAADGSFEAPSDAGADALDGASDAASPVDATSSPDGSLNEAGCEVRSDAGSCESPESCWCPWPESCALACPGDVGGADIECAQASCTASCGPGCAVEGTEAPDCAASVGAGGSVECTNAGTCEATVGDGGSVECTNAGSCSVVCEGSCSVECVDVLSGACRVHCDADAGCAVDCAPRATVACPDGGFACNPSAC